MPDAARIERTFAGGQLVKEVEFCVVGQPETATTGLVMKEGAEDRYLLTVAYPAMRLEKNMAADGHRDFASERVVEIAAWRFMQKGAQLGMWHQEGFEQAAECVESYIYRNPVPWDIPMPDGSTQQVCKGDWCVGSILQPPTWALYKAGLIGGMSPQGRAARGPASDSRLAELRS